MEAINSNLLNKIMTEYAVAHIKTPDEVRALFTIDYLYSIGYYVEETAVSLAQKISSAQVEAGENAILASLRQKGLA